ncbi:hypothetical protein IWW38_001175, partial [Coemansia aciculifera]
MIQRKDVTQGVLPQVPARTLAFAYRPYATGATTISSALLHDHQPPQQLKSLLFDLQRPRADSSSSCDSDDDDDVAGARIVVSDRQLMAQLHAQAVLARVKEAKRLVDDERFEYACDVVLECQRGFNFLGKANFSAKLLHPMDPPPWCDSQMQLTLATVHSFQLPDPSWHWVSPRWLIDMTQEVDEDGWQYASRFSSSTSWHGRQSAATSFVRRRRWLRLRRRPKKNDGGLSDEEEEAVVDAECRGTVKKEKKGIKAAAIKIKSKVSGGYVGSSPKSPTSPKAKVLAYTLKDGKYRSHALKQQPQTSPPPPPLPFHPRCRDIQDDLRINLPAADLPLSEHGATSLSNSIIATTTTTTTSISNSSRETQQQLALQALRRRVSVSSSWPAIGDVPSPSQQRYYKSRHVAVGSTRDAAAGPLPLPTGGFAVSRINTGGSLAAAAELLGSATGSQVVEDAENDDYSGGGGEQVVARLPRLTALAPPESTVPLGEFQQKSGPARTVFLSSDEDACGSTVVASSQADVRSNSKCQESPVPKNTPSITIPSNTKKVMSAASLSQSAS